MSGRAASRTSATDPRRPQDRHLARRSVLDALHAISEAVTLALLEDHPELLLRVPQGDPGLRDLEEEAQRLVDLLEQIHDAVHRYALLADPDDDLPF